MNQTTTFALIVVLLGPAGGIRAEKPEPSAVVAKPSASLPMILEHKVLRVGMAKGVIPFVVTGPNIADVERLVKESGGRDLSIVTSIDGQRVCGFDVELALAAAKALSARLDIVLVDRIEDLLPGLKKGNYEVVISSFTRTLEHARTVAFTDPYFASGLQLLVRDRSRFGSLDALGNARVLVRANSTSERFAKERLKTSKLTSVPSEEALVSAIVNNDYDAVVIDYVTARDAQVRGKFGKTPPLPLEERRYTTEHFAFVVRQGDPDWLAWLNLFLYEHRTSGAFHRLAARFNPWFRAER